MAISGRAVALVALGAIPLALRPIPATVALWSMLVALLCIIDVAWAASPRRVAVVRSKPSAVRLTQTTRVSLTFTNLSSRKLRALIRDAWQPSAGAHAERHHLSLPSGESGRIITVLTPTRRGERHADRVTIRAFGPLGLAARQASLPVPGVLRVLPEFASRRHLPSRLARLREMDGRAAVLVRGQGTEFDSLREYVPGDDVRSIDWRATARRSEVVVRTWRPERDRRVLIVLDTSRTSAARVGGAPRLEAAIDAALLLGALATRAGDRVDLLAIDRRTRARVAGASGDQLLPAFASAAVGLEPRLVEVDWTLVADSVRQQLSQRSLVVLLTALDPAAAEGRLLPTVHGIARDHQVIVASVGDPELAELRAERGDAEAVFNAAAAERVSLERAAMGRILGRHRVEVIEAGPTEIAPKLADSYLALKAAGRL